MLSVLALKMSVSNLLNIIRSVPTLAAKNFEVDVKIIV